uniref:EGF-like domain-containing protein n=1 Tax=Ascaris lumbricoides TaxID=6252 RepID=A0A0M3IFY1_ASCLU
MNDISLKYSSDPEPRSEFESSLKMIKTTISTVYVPMGRNLKLRCAAFDKLDYTGSYPIWNESGKNTVWTAFSPFGFTRIRKMFEPSHFNYSSQSKYPNDGILYAYTIQKRHETLYDCHILAKGNIEWVSRVLLVVQDCDTEENELKAYNNKRNPCQYGACVVEPFPQTPEFERVKCNCVTQYTGEFCNVLVEGALIRELIHFSPFIGHMLAFLFVFIFYFCCRHGDSKPKISLIDEVPEVPRTIDDPKMLYPAALLPEIEEEQQHEEELDAFAKKISLIDEVPEVPRTIDDPKVLYPAALLPEIEEEQQHEEELDAFAVTKLLKELQKS